MASSKHQRLVNSLAKALEDKEGVEITHIDIDGTPEYFDTKYHNLPTPRERNGRIPDLEGEKNGVVHLGEAKTDIGNYSNIDSQLKAFSGRKMTQSKKPVPLHISVPQNMTDDLRKKINNLGLSNAQIIIWSSQ